LNLDEIGCFGLNSLQTARWMLWFRDASGGSDRYEFDYTD
jgi:hypothetical protein